jgi:uncharacterized protein YqiB (DUF1249 family)
MKKTIYETNYERLNKILGGLLETMDFESIKLESKGFMDLHIDKIGENEISLTHYYKQNGDTCPDPDMQIKVHPEMKMIEALTYQDSFSYQEVYPKPGYVYPALKKQLNSFLRKWLINLTKQGFKYEPQNFNIQTQRKAAEVAQ